MTFDERPGSHSIFTPGEEKWMAEGENKKMPEALTEAEWEEQFALKHPGTEVNPVRTEDDVTEKIIRPPVKKPALKVVQKPAEPARPRTEEEADEDVAEGDPMISRWLKEGREGKAAPEGRQEAA